MRINIRKFLVEFKSNQPLSISGIAIGSSMYFIPNSLIESINPNVEYPTAYEGKEVFRVLDDGTRQAVSSDQRYREVEKFGGGLGTAGIWWHIKNYSVQRYEVKGDKLAAFEIHDEHGIVDVFGDPDRKLMSGLGIVYYYFHAQLALVWSRKKGKLVSVQVGNFVSGLHSHAEKFLKGVLHISGIKKIGLSSLKQSYTYAGLLVGSPTSRLNNRIIEGRLKSAQTASTSNVYLIEPPRVKRESQQSDSLGEPEDIPAICCIGEFESLDPVSDEDAHGSELTYLWFQDEFAMPIDECVCTAIESSNWDELANDILYS